jgi:hypothetical protein
MSVYVERKQPKEATPRRRREDHEPKEATLLRRVYPPVDDVNLEEVARRRERNKHRRTTDVDSEQLALWKAKHD